MKTLETLPVKKVIALLLVLVYIILTSYDTIANGKAVSESFITTCTMVVAYYFGRSHGKEEQNGN